MGGAARGSSQLRAPALLDPAELTAKERQWLDRYFMSRLFPVLTPLAVDPGHPFPFISNLSTSLGVMLRGRWLDREMLDARLAEIAARYQQR